MICDFLVSSKLCFQIQLVPLQHGWRVSRGTAVCMLGFYLVFSVVYALIAAGVIFQTQWT
jgi:hypothetical protein